MTESKRSKYAEKRARGNMMYGPGCCANNLVITQEMREEMNRRKRLLEKHEREAARRHAFYRKFGEVDG